MRALTSIISATSLNATIRFSNFHIPLYPYIKVKHNIPDIDLLNYDNATFINSCQVIVDKYAKINSQMDLQEHLEPAVLRLPFYIESGS